MDISKDVDDFSDLPSITVGTSSTLALAANKDREYAAIINDSNETIYLKLGTGAELHKGIRLNANGGAFEITKANPYKGIITAICESGNKTLLVNEGVGM